MRPVRDDVVEARARRAVRILVGSHVDTTCARSFNGRDRLRHLAPVCLARRLEMMDLHPCAGALTDGYGFLDRLDETRAFGTHVRGVTSAMRGRDPGKFDDFVCR